MLRHILFLQCLLLISSTLVTASPIQSTHHDLTLSLLQHDLNLTSFHNRVFRVPDTLTVLRLSSVQEPPLDLTELYTLLLIAQAQAQEGIDAHGGAAFYQQGGPFQYFQVESSGVGLILWKNEDRPRGFRFYTWQQLLEVIEGLLLFMVDWRRSDVTSFTFWNGPGQHPERGRNLGQGVVGRVADENVDARIRLKSANN